MVTVAETGEKVGYLLNQNSDEPSTTTTGEGGKQSFVDSFALLSSD